MQVTLTVRCRKQNDSFLEIILPPAKGGISEISQKHVRERRETETEKEIALGDSFKIKHKTLCL